MSKHILILGGHGKVAQHLTSALLAKPAGAAAAAGGVRVTSVIRAADQIPAIQRLAPAGSDARLTVLVRSLEDVADKAHAQAILDEVRPDTVVFSAGAGGKGGSERTLAIDRDAAIHFIRAAVATPSISKFILVSYLASRRAQPAWWDASAWADAQTTNQQLATYYQAKLAADEFLVQAARERTDAFLAVSLRPGTLTDEPARAVELGRTRAAGGKVSREAVAQVAAQLALAEDVAGLQTVSRNAVWLDLLDGDEGVAEAVQRVLTAGDSSNDALEGEAVASS